MAFVAGGSSESAPSTAMVAVRRVAVRRVTGRRIGAVTVFPAVAADSGRPWSAWASPASLSRRTASGSAVASGGPLIEVGNVGSDATGSAAARGGASTLSAIVVAGNGPSRPDVFTGKAEAACGARGADDGLDAWSILDVIGAVGTVSPPGLDATPEAGGSGAAASGSVGVSRATTPRAESATGKGAGGVSPEGRAPAENGVAGNATCTAGDAGADRSETGNPPPSSRLDVAAVATTRPRSVTGFEVTGFEVTGFEVTGFEVMSTSARASTVRGVPVETGDTGVVVAYDGDGGDG